MEKTTKVTVGCLCVTGLMAANNMLYAVDPEVIPANEGLSISTESYLSYQDGKKGDTDYSQMRIKRGYINITKKILRWDDFASLEGRATPDVHQEDNGDIKMRMKYLYGKLKSTATWEPYLEFGLVHTPWIDYEEHINRYRMQDTMFIERGHTLSSADLGATLGGYFGPKETGADFGHYPGRYGSFAVGIYNGGGYHAKEMNTDKPIEARISLRPLPTVVPGLQISYFGVYGNGNAVTAADWNVNMAMVSYEQKHLAATAQYYEGEGNQGNTAIDSDGNALSRQGYSFFTELRKIPELPSNLSLIGRFDHFDFNTDASNDQSDRSIAGIAWDMGGHNTWLLDYDTTDYKSDDSKDDDRIQLTLQIKY